MMDLSHIFDSIEKLAYDILIWILLIPKTLVKILTEPGWVRQYVSKELGEQGEERFDDYLSPVMLLLIVSLLPYLFLLITPFPGLTVDSSIMNDGTYGEVEMGTEAAFWAIPDFIADTQDYTYTWQAEGATLVSGSNDFKVYKWNESGYHMVTVTASNNMEESFTSMFEVYVLPEGQSLAAGSAGNTDFSATSQSNSGMLKQLEGEGMIAPALLFLSLPMLFAIATEAFRGYPLTRSSLMRSFYVQCYYFSPFIFSVWILFLGVIYFVTTAEWFTILLVLVTPLAALAWLLWNEITAIHSERKPKSKWVSVAIVLACTMVIAVLVGIAFVFLSNPELFRQFLKWLFMLGLAGLVASRFLTRRNRRQVEAASSTIEQPGD